MHSKKKLLRWAEVGLGQVVAVGLEEGAVGVEGYIVKAAQCLEPAVKEFVVSGIPKAIRSSFPIHWSQDQEKDQTIQKQ